VIACNNIATTATAAAAAAATATDRFDRNRDVGWQRPAADKTIH